MTDQYLRDMQADVQEAEKSVAAQIALEKKFKILFEEQEALVKNVKSKLIWLFKQQLRCASCTRRKTKCTQSKR